MVVNRSDFVGGTKEEERRRAHARLTRIYEQLRETNENHEPMSDELRKEVMTIINELKPLINHNPLARKVVRNILTLMKQIDVVGIYKSDLGDFEIISSTNVVPDANIGQEQTSRWQVLKNVFGGIGSAFGMGFGGSMNTRKTRKQRKQQRKQQKSRKQRKQQRKQQKSRKQRK